MPDPIVFATEAERQRAREQYVAINRVMVPSWSAAGATFDDYFPPIAPPKMVPEEWLTFVNPAGHRTGDLYPSTSPLTATGDYRIARVRVEEIEDGND